ncbi:MAG: type II secretion system F family protein, partial [Ignavibacteriales bacterium]|nr:type II secretion system F family protein [Ignavibacteriales bacterium]
MAAGEESAELDKVLMQMSIYYSSEFDHYLDNLTSLLEPVLILFVGGIVAVILIGLYLPTKYPIGSALPDFYPDEKICKESISFAERVLNDVNRLV